ncbi:MAG: TlpA disulfide reductase family protein [Mariprofundales bacterium]|nr:TlpA disulfide reductase family protein [Mariprofundales bacterium]
MKSTTINRVLCLLLLMALTTLTACSGGDGARKVLPQKGAPLPNLMMRDLSGGVAASKDLFHGKVVILNVWATWCPPCRKEMPDLIRLSKQLPSSDFAVIGLSVDEDLQALQQFIGDHGVNFPIYWDQGGRAVAADRLGVVKYPETFILNRKGIIIDKVIGAYPWASAHSIKILHYIADHGEEPK